MNKKELKAELKRLGVSEDSFDLNGGHLSERYTLRHNLSGGWHVYYSERGLETGRRDFSTESEACQYLLHLIKTDEDLILER